MPKTEAIDDLVPLIAHISIPINSYDTTAAAPTPTSPRSCVCSTLQHSSQGLLAWGHHNSVNNMASLNTLLRAHRSMSQKQLDATLQDIAADSLRAVDKLIEDGREFINTKDTMSFSSVCISTLFCALYLAYFWSKEFVIGRVNSKAHDALAIVLPFLLPEEMATALSLVFLWLKWGVVAWWTDRCRMDGESPQAKVFERHVEQQCLLVGVGAPDMRGAATFITSFWSLFFLIQGAIADRFGTDGDEHGAHPDHRWLVFVYWFLIVYSAALVAFCYLPFVCFTSQLQKEDQESVVATSRAFLFLQRMSKVQDTIVRSIDTRDDVLGDHRMDILRCLRRQTLDVLDDDTVLSHALYVTALSTYDFKTKCVANRGRISELKRQATLHRTEQHALRPLPANTSVWNQPIGCPVCSAFMSVLERLPSPTGHHNSSNAPLSLFSVPVMARQTLKDVFAERSIKDISTLFDCSVVQKKTIYGAVDNDSVVCVGVEIKLMKYYTVSIYFLSETESVFGNGLIYVSVNEMPTKVKLYQGGDNNEQLLTLKQVKEKDRRRAFDKCTMNVADLVALPVEYEE
ncbi:Aste57867_23569 [Aphanomyces stellatus]|uniref:Aste57867_23569 protein n=1 Tax=Aphanomyces stellatus TaxID=120398 RepID=A0A485LNV8_9STRA|nr:hypothetical protein As57867_023498 [Aphanomyces stellatus]VFU00214.1 Aste57867_23569 [Aphanomyces stellatus]